MYSNFLLNQGSVKKGCLNIELYLNECKLGFCCRWNGSSFFFWNFLSLAHAENTWEHHPLKEQRALQLWPSLSKPHRTVYIFLIVFFFLYNWNEGKRLQVKSETSLKAYGNRHTDHMSFRRIWSFDTSGQQSNLSSSLEGLKGFSRLGGLVEDSMFWIQNIELQNM